MLTRNNYKKKKTKRMTKRKRVTRGGGNSNKSLKINSLETELNKRIQKLKENIHTPTKSPLSIREKERKDSLHKRQPYIDERRERERKREEGKKVIYNAPWGPVKKNQLKNH